MIIKNQAKRNLRRIGLVLLLVGVFFLLEPSISERLSFAVTYFDNPRIDTQGLSVQFANVQKEATPERQRSHAPEPSSLFLILSGMGGVIARFARRSFERFKRISDFLLAMIGVVIASPILVFAAILIKLTSRGPVIYRQSRIGLNGEVFRIYKLRTMQADAEQITGAVWARENDPRITPVGRVLRKTHIDEIPQLFNVLRGQMSIVGPRPERPEIVRDLKKLIRDYEKRLQIRPGITGLAQVWHKYDETINDVKKKIKYDLLYIKRMCLMVDLRILAQTLIVVMTGRGAR